MPLKDGNFIVQDSGDEQVEISKNGNATIVNTSYKNNPSQPSSQNLKKGYIKPKKVRDWFDEKKKRVMRALLSLGRLG